MDDYGNVPFGELGKGVVTVVKPLRVFQGSRRPES